MLPRPRSDGRGRGGTIEAMDQKLAMLSKVPLFAGLCSHDLTELGRLVDEVDVKQGKVLAQEGSELGSVESEQARATGGRQSDDSPVSVGNETGADFVVAVRMASILDQVEGEKAKFYKINFELISPTSGEKTWIGDYEIKKLISQDSASW